MTNYMIRFKELANPVYVDLDSYDKDHEGSKQIKTATERFLSAAKLLPDNEYLGWEVEVKSIDRITTIAFSSKNVKITEKDFSWILKAKTPSLKSDLISMEKSFWEGRFVYALSVSENRPSYKKPDSSANRNGRRFFYDDDDDDDDGIYDYTNNLNNFLELMMEFEKTYFRILVGNCSDGENQGIIMISLPEEIPLRMKTELSIIFPNVCISKVKDNNHEEGIRTLPSSIIADAFSGMLKTVIFYNHSISDLGEKMYSLHKNFESDDEEFLPDEDVEYKEVKKDSKTRSLTDTTPLEDLELSTRTYDCLKKAGVTTIGELRFMDYEDLMNVQNLGRESMEEIESALESNPMLIRETSSIITSYTDALDGLIGLAPVKEQIRKITAYARMKQDMKKLGKADIPIVLNMEFIGNPGTAKTTVARILAGIFHEIGLLATSEIVEVGRADLIARYEGQTADKVRRVFNSALGKILFIDEAYSLVEHCNGEYGDEAINTIVQEMENRRDEVIVVFAGYPKEMDAFFSRNPGLRSRVPFKITFSDYSADEMGLISEMEAKKRGFTIHEEAKDKIVKICGNAKADVNTGNGRFCRNLIENAILDYALRVYGGNETTANRDCVLIEADFSDSIIAERKAAIPIGFRVA